MKAKIACHRCACDFWSCRWGLWDECWSVSISASAWPWASSRSLRWMRALFQVHNWTRGFYGLIYWRRAWARAHLWRLSLRTRISAHHVELCEPKASYTSQVSINKHHKPEVLNFMCYQSCRSWIVSFYGIFLLAWFIALQLDIYIFSM